MPDRSIFKALGLTLAALLASPAAAQGWSQVADKAQFVALVQDRDLRMPLFGITLQVRPDGGITGRASGREVTGSWSWEDGFFCREMAWGGREFAANCQVVETTGDRIRFVADRGAGSAADFGLR